MRVGARKGKSTKTPNTIPNISIQQRARFLVIVIPILIFKAEIYQPKKDLWNRHPPEMKLDNFENDILLMFQATLLYSESNFPDAGHTKIGVRGIKPISSINSLDSNGHVAHVRVFSNHIEISILYRLARNINNIELKFDIS